MIFKKTDIDGPFIIELAPHEDERGLFARNFCLKEFKFVTGEDFNIAQINLSFNKQKGTIRGFHLQKVPTEEGKIVQCFYGSVFDVAVDLRMDSPTFGKWTSVVLTPEKRNLFYIPKGFGHAIQALEDNTLIQYFVSQFYSPEHETGVRWDDPQINVKWPIPTPAVISARDGKLPYLKNLFT